MRTEDVATNEEEGAYVTDGEADDEKNINNSCAFRLVLCCVVVHR